MQEMHRFTRFSARLGPKQPHGTTSLVCCIASFRCFMVTVHKQTPSHHQTPNKQCFRIIGMRRSPNYKQAVGIWKLPWPTAQVCHKQCLARAGGRKHGPETKQAVQSGRQPSQDPRDPPNFGHKQSSAQTQTPHKQGIS